MNILKTRWINNRWINNRWTKILLAIVIVVGLYGAAGHWLLPWWLKSFIPQQIESATGRKAQLTDIDINPYTLEVWLKDLKIMGPKGKQPAVELGGLYANASVASIIHLGPVIDQLRINQPQIRFARLAPHRFSFDDILKRFKKTTPKKPKKKPASQPHFAIYNIQIKGGQIDFDDHVTGQNHRISALNFSLPFISNLAHKVNIFTKPALSARIDGSLLQLHGHSKPFAKTRATYLDLNLNELNLANYTKLVPASLDYRPETGTLSSHLVLSFKLNAAGKAQVELHGSAKLDDLAVHQKSTDAELKIGRIALAIAPSQLLARQFNLADLNIRKITLVKPGKHGLNAAIGKIALGKTTYADNKLRAASLQLKQLELHIQGHKQSAVAISSIVIGLTRYGDHKAQIASLDISQPQLSVQRNRNGSIDLLSAVKSLAGNKTASGSAAQPLAKPKAGKTAPVVTLAHFKLTKGTIQVADYTAAQPVHLKLEHLTLGASNLTTRKGAKLPITLATDIGKGHVAVNGHVTLDPLTVALDTHVKSLNLAFVQGYLASKLNVKLRRVDFSTRGKLQLSKPAHGAMRTRYRGNLAATRLDIADKLTGQPFLNWRALRIAGLDFRYPARGAPFAVSTGNISLSDFYARVILNSDARLNVQDVISGKQAKPISVTTPTNTPAPAKPAPAKLTKAGPAPRIALGKITLKNGRVNYTDHYIKPHYSTTMEALGGSIGAISSTKPVAAPINLHGTLNSGGNLKIVGTVNPLAKPLALDMGIDANGIELTRLSPYSAKYAGYNIDKGKLSVKLHYKLDHQQLQATNHVFLNQLTFGNHVDNQTATHLPVRLAVALLKDPSGNINIDLPISGSLSDPKFSITGVLISTLGNLIAKAITAPFSLLGRALGLNGEQLSYVQFKPGFATLDAKAKTKLKTLIKALKNRPSLTLDIAGRADPATDTEGLRHAILLRKLRQAKLAASGKSLTNLEQTTLTSKERDKYLEIVYDQAKFKKPTNFLGMTKSQPPATMEKMLLAQIHPDRVMLKALARKRANVVLNYLAKQGKVPNSQMFLTSSHIGTKGMQGKGTTSRVDFTLK